MKIRIHPEVNLIFHRRGEMDRMSWFDPVRVNSGTKVPPPVLKLALIFARSPGQFYGGRMVEEISTSQSTVRPSFVFYSEVVRKLAQKNSRRSTTAGRNSGTR
jgi:hypothetical protein